MKIRKTTISVVAASLLISSITFAQATEEAALTVKATSFTEAFTKGTASGQIRVGYIWLNPDEEGAFSTRISSRRSS